jgi:hypothetical protein
VVKLSVEGWWDLLDFGLFTFLFVVVSQLILMRKEYLEFESFFLKFNTVLLI